MNDDQAPESLAELGRWISSVGHYIQSAGVLMRAGQLDWAALMPSRDLRAIAAALRGGHGDVADVLTCLALGRQPVRDDQAHPLAEFIAHHPRPDSLALGLTLLWGNPALVGATEADLLAAIAALRAVEE